MSGILIFDMSQILFANLMAYVNNKHIEEKSQLSEDLLRHMILNTIRAIKSKYTQFNDVVIAVDSSSWRYKIFKYYKAKRKAQRDQYQIDWKQAIDIFGKITSEIKDNFPYRVIKVENAEADDIIAQIAYLKGNETDIMIISGDKDLRQLQTNKRVYQYDPIRKRDIREDDPQQYLLEHILRGDTSDNIPNVLSDDDCLVTDGKRQTALTSQKMRTVIQQLDSGTVDKKTLAYYHRNDKLINLQNTPQPIKEEIVSQFEQQGGKTRSKLFKYFVSKQLTSLISNIQDF